MVIKSVELSNKKQTKESSLGCEPLQNFVDQDHPGAASELCFEYFAPLPSSPCIHCWGDCTILFSGLFYSSSLPSSVQSSGFDNNIWILGSYLLGQRAAPQNPGAAFPLLQTSLWMDGRGECPLTIPPFPNVLLSPLYLFYNTELPHGWRIKFEIRTQSIRGDCAGQLSDSHEYLTSFSFLERINLVHLKF